MTLMQKNHGVTVVELMVVLAIIASIMGLGAYSLSAIGAGDLKSDAMRLTSVIKYTYSNAGINNTRYRLVMKLGTGEYWTEVADSPVVTESETLDDDFLTDEARALADERAEETDLFDEREDNPFGMRRKVSYERVQDIVIKQTKLSDGVVFDKIYSPRFPDGPVEEGEMAISFYPNGFQEQAMIVIRNEAGQAYTLITEPMTGRVKLFGEEIDVPDGFGEVERDD